MGLDPGMPLIPSENSLGIAAILFLLVAGGVAIEKSPIGKTISAPLVILFGAMAASNLGVIPHSAPIYSTASSLLVPVAIPLILMRADLKKVVTEAGPMLIAFVVAVTLTIAGTFAAAAIIDMGEDAAKIAGALAASYIGGSLNFVATAEAVGLDDSSLYIAALSADAVGAILFLALLLLLPSVAIARKAMPSKFLAIENEQSEMNSPPVTVEDQGARFRLDLSVNGIAVSLAICLVAQGIASAFDADFAFILIVTVLALVVANFAKPVTRFVRHEFEVGTLLMYVFFGAIGAGAEISAVVGSAMPAALFITVLITVHLALLLIVGRILRLDLAEAMIASNACILGPATAAAMAASRGWKELVTPGVLVGSLGYSIATFIGIAITKILA